MKQRSLFTALFLSAATLLCRAADPGSEYWFCGNDTVTVDGSLRFFDNGGPDGFYNRDHSGVVVFRPSHPDRTLSLKFNYFIAGYNDQLLIYNGSECVDDQLLIRLYGDKAQTRDLVSTAADGSLAAWFKTGQYGLMLEGWDIVIEEFAPEPLAVAEVTAAAEAPATVFPGSDDNRMIHFVVTTAGERGSLALEGLELSASGEPGMLAGVALWCSGEAESFAAAEKIGSVSPAGLSEFSLPASYVFSQPATYHFWLTADIAPGAGAGSRFAVSLDGVTVAGESFAPQGVAQASSSTRQGMHGNFVVGQSEAADYKTFNQAIRDLANRGVDGPVNMLVEPGSYGQILNFLPVPGASERNHVTFAAQSGSPDDVVIAYGESDKAMSQGVVNFTDGSSFITLRNLTVEARSKSCPGVIYMQGGCMHNTLEGCIVRAPASASYEQRHVLVYTTYLEEDNKNCNFFTIQGCRLEGGYYGLSVTGITNLNHPIMIHDVTVADNTFVDQACKAMQAMGVKDGLTVRGNVFANSGRVMTSPFHTMDIYRCTGRVEIAGNRADIIAADMTTSDGATRAGTATGIYIRDITNTYPSAKLIYNNDLRLHGIEGSDHGLFGIYIDDNTAGQSLHIAHNTLLLTGDSSPYSAPLMLDAPTPGSSLRANLLQNTLGGVAFRATAEATLTQMTIDGNVLFASNEVLALTPDEIESMEALAAAAGQPVGLVEPVAFLADDIREPSAQGSLCSAPAVDFVTTDITGAPRPAQNRTAGAYEYRNQSGTPQWLDGLPSLEQLGSASVLLILGADKASTARVAVLEASEPAPADFEDAQTVLLHSMASESLRISGLSDDTDYIAYIALTSVLGEEAPTVQIAFRTLFDEPSYAIPVASAHSTSGLTGNEGEEIIMEGTVAGGLEPFVYRWTDGAGNVIGSETSVATILTHSQTYTFTATDARGKEASAELNIEVRGNRYVATFEDLQLAPESHWAGTPANRPFFSGSFAFDNYNGTDADYSYWGNFTYANCTARNYESLADQFNCSAGSGALGSPTYAVAYLNSYTGATYLSVTHDEAGDTIPGLWLTNTAWVADAIARGDGLSDVEGGFAHGDFLKISITGLLDSRNVGTVDFYPADFRFDNPADRYALDSWQWVDLSSLGRVNKLWFRMESTKRNAYGMTTPAYFCLDNVGDDCPWRDVAEVVLSAETPSFRLYDFLSWEPSDATVSYELTDDAGGKAHLSDPNGGVVLVTEPAVEEGGEPFTLSATASRQGQKDYLRIPVRVSRQSGVENLEAPGVIIKLFGRTVVISTELQSYTAEIFDAAGRCVMRRPLCGNATLPLSLAPGTYIVRAGAETRRITLR